MSASNRLREELSAAFLSALQEGQLPWRAVWRSSRPCNAVTDRPYRGVNTLNLSWIADQRGYTDPRWCTFHQASEKGWKVRKGEKAARVEYWTMYDRVAKRTIPWAEATALVQENPEREKDLQLRCYISSVFNAAQLEGIPPLPERPAVDMDAVLSQRDTLVNNMHLAYREKGDRAYYSLERDMVTLPPIASFEDVYGYMSTFLHECGHATGHPSRLNRPMNGRFGSPEYAREELRSEIASAFAAQSIGLRMSDAALEEHMNLHKAYVQSWVSILSEKSEELFAAIKDANAIADYLIDIVEHPVISAERAKELYWCFEHETNEPETQEWREELSAEEEQLVERWEDTYAQDVAETVTHSKAKTETMRETEKTPRKPRFTEEQLLAARECSALEYARSRGYDLVNKGSSYQLREHDSMVFLPDGGWFWNSRQKHGRAIEFMMEYEHMTLPEAVLRLNGIDPERRETRAAPDYRPKAPENRQEKTLQLPERAESMKRMFSYLANTRGIDYDLLRRLAREGRIYQSSIVLSAGTEVSNAVFVGLDETGAARSASLRGCGSGSTFRLEAAGSDKSYPFTIAGREGCKRLYVFESPIDAMSHATLRILGEQLAFDGDRISLGGSGRVEAILRALHQNPGVEEIIFCLDNDEAGRSITARLREELMQRGIASRQLTEERVPCGKDWNEYLQTWRGVVAHHEDYGTTREMDEKDMTAAVCGRIHLLDGDGAVAQTYSYRSMAHFRNAARLYQSRGTPCVIETPRQREAEQRKRERLASVRKTREAGDDNDHTRHEPDFAKRTEDGIEVYETSDKIKRMAYKQRMEYFVDIMQNEYAGRTAKFTANGEVYYARFNSTDLKKNIYGDKRSDRSGWRAKVNTGADGNIFELIENAQYDRGREETGKMTAAHRDVTGWEYFIKTVQIDGKVYDLLANIRKKPDGEYVYSIQLNESKKKAPAPLLERAYTGANAQVGCSENGVLTNASADSIRRNGEKVNHQISAERSDNAAPPPQRRSFKALAAEAKEIAAARNAERTAQRQAQNLELPSRDSS